MNHTIVNECRSAPQLIVCDISNFTHAFIDINTEHRETMNQGLVRKLCSCIFFSKKTENNKNMIFECAHAQMCIALVYIRDN